MTNILEESGFDPNRKLRIVGTSPVKPDGRDKVTGRAKFGADLALPGMLVGKVLRSPHPHAIIKFIDTSRAQALPGVMAVVTRDDFPEIPPGTGEGDLTRNVMAREKALYDGHAVAAVAATSESIAKQALKLIRVDYEKLPHVIDAVEAMAPGAPILHEHLRAEGIKGAEDKPTNVVERQEFRMGDVEAGFREADVVIEREFRTCPIHQGYIGGPGRAVVLHAGAFRHARQPCFDPRYPQGRDLHHRRGNRRRIRRQDHHVRRAARHSALAQGEAPGENRPKSQRSVPRHRPGVRNAFAHQDGGHPQRQVHRGGGRDGVPVRRVHRLDVLQRGADDVHALRSEERQGGRLRGGV
ncbi:MAG: hypothetical protein HYU75_02375 [Betaproteobacteria bacterium]|nr:hypothetical protein [Betaproteobacteria bacterium]